MALFERSINDIIGEMILEVSADSQLNKLSPGSKVRVLLQTTARHLNQAYQIFDANLARAFLSGATGQYVDFIGELLGVKRLNSDTAKASSEAKIVKFFVETGTFGAINGGNPIVIPAGKLISTAQNNTGIVYRLIAGTVLSASANEAWVNVEAVSPGTESNVNNNSLIFHNFTDYTDFNNNTLKVTNVSGIFNGANPESESNYKYRISQSALASEAANDTAIILSSLSVPGVANVVLQKRAYGIGTYAIYIKSVTPTVSQNLIEAVKSAGEAVTAEGVKGYFLKPKETGLSVEVSVKYKNGVSEQEKDAIDQQIINNVKDFVNNGDIGRGISIGDIEDRILFASDNIESIGNSDKRIVVYIYRETKLQDSKIKQELLSDYTASSNERVIMEPSVINSVLITRLN